MPSLIDASCPKCRKRFGWSGTASDRPDCPRCGYRPPQEDLEAADKEMEEFEKLLASRPASDTIRKQRVAAGLTLLQAAKLLGIEARRLSNMEWGRESIDPAMEQKMADLYDVGGSDAT